MSKKSCWRQVGVWGDRTCDALAAITHCHYCSVYISASAQLLQRKMPADYQAEQTAQLSAPAVQANVSQRLSTLIFRLGKEWLAVPADICLQILPPVKAHTLPHRSNQTLLGVVNVRGQLLLKVSLLQILSLASVPAVPSVAPATKPSATKPVNNNSVDRTKNGIKVYSRMVVVGHGPDSWVFEVDELYGIDSVSPAHLESIATESNAITHAIPDAMPHFAVPSVANTLLDKTCTRAVFPWHGQRVSLLDDSRLFKALRQQAL